MEEFIFTNKNQFEMSVNNCDECDKAWRVSMAKVTEKYHTRVHNSLRMHSCSKSRFDNSESIKITFLKQCEHYYECLNIC